MAKLELSEVAHEHPLLQTENLDGVLTYFHQAQNNYPLSSMIPMNTVNADKVVFDIEKVSRGGMTPMVTRNEEAPIYNNPHGRGREKWEPAAFREKCTLEPHELDQLRQLGTREDLVTSAQMLRMRFRSLEIRLANRLEYMRKQMIFDNQVTATMEDGRQYTVPYAHADYLEPSVATTWDQTGTATPMADLQQVIEDYENDTGKMVSRIIMPHDIMSDLVPNERFRDLALQNLGTFNGGREEISQLMIDVLGVGEVTISKDRINFSTDLTADAAAGQNQIQVRDSARLSAGTDVYLHHADDDDREKRTVSSVSGNTVTFNNNIQKTGGFSANDPVRYSEYTIPSDQILIIGSDPANMSRSDEGSLVTNFEDRPWAEVISTISRYADMDNPQPGMYTRSIDMTQADPPRIEQVLGINALPRLNDQDAFLNMTIR